MSRRPARQLHHPPYVAQAREHPHTWVRVRTYDTPGIAAFIASTICDGTHPAYRDPGHFHADIRPTAAGGYALWISYQPPEQP